MAWAPKTSQAKAAMTFSVAWLSRVDIRLSKKDSRVL